MIVLWKVRSDIAAPRVRLSPERSIFQLQKYYVGERLMVYINPNWIIVVLVSF